MIFNRALICVLLALLGMFTPYSLAIDLVDEDATNNAGKVVKYLGHVEVLGDPNSSSVVIDGQGTVADLRSNSVVTTDMDSRAYIKLVDGSKIILRENSSIRLNGFSDIGVDKGKVLFSVAKRSKDVFRVATKIALLGVRGTSFLVDHSKSEQDLAVHLKEGLVTVSATGKDFAYVKQELKAEFENYEKEMKSEFESYKKQHVKEFREYVKKIDMQAHDVLSISNSEARNLEWSEEFDSWFDEFDASFF